MLLRESLKLTGLLLVLGLGSPALPEGRTDFYTLGVNSNGSGINMYRVDTQTGALTPVAGQPFGVGASLATADSTPNGRFVYGADSVKNEIVGFRLETSSGALTPLPDFPKPTLANATVSIDDGDHLYVVGENRIEGFNIDGTTGALSALTGFPLKVPGLVKAKVGRFTHTGFVYVSDVESDQLFAFRHDEKTGSLTPLGTTPSGEDPDGLQVDDTRRFLYVSHRDGTLLGFSIGADGKLTRATPKPVVFGPAGQLAYHFTVKEGIMYIGDSVNNNLQAFHVAKTGTLSPVAGYPAVGLGGNTVMAFHNPLLPYIYIGRPDAHQINGFRVDAQGQRSAVPGLPLKGAGSPTNMESVEVTL